MESLNGKHFSITDPKGVNTVIYEVFKTKKEFLDKYDDFYFPTNLPFDDVPFHIKSLLRANKILIHLEFFQN